MPKKKAREFSAATSNPEMSEMMPLKGKRRATSARKVLMSRENMGAATTREKSGRRKRTEKSFMFAYIRAT